jgi:hypothetical protein
MIELKNLELRNTKLKSTELCFRFKDNFIKFKLSSTGSNVVCRPNISGVAKHFGCRGHFQV